MGEIISFPGTDRPIFELDPSRDESFDMIIDEARLTGSCLYSCDGRMYELTVEELDGKTIDEPGPGTTPQA